MNLELLTKIATQVKHIDMLEDLLLGAQIELKTMREEYEEIIQQSIKESR